MKKRAAIVLILYAVLMLSYGSLEITHDLLHYLADHYHSHLHDHEHSHHHHVHDHQHTFVVQSDDQETAETDLPSLVNFFLFAQCNPSFTFTNTLFDRLTNREVGSPTPVVLNLTTPPPKG